MEFGCLFLQMCISRTDAPPGCAALTGATVSPGRMCWFLLRCAKLGNRPNTVQTLPCSGWNSHLVNTILVPAVVKGSSLQAVWTLVVWRAWLGRPSQDYALMPSPGRLSLCLPLLHSWCPFLPCLALFSADVFVTAGEISMKGGLVWHREGNGEDSVGKGHCTEPSWGCCRLLGSDVTPLLVQ